MSEIQIDTEAMRDHIAELAKHGDGDPIAAIEARLRGLQLETERIQVETERLQFTRQFIRMFVR